MLANFRSSDWRVLAKSEAGSNYKTIHEALPAYNMSILYCVLHVRAISIGLSFSSCLVWDGSDDVAASRVLYQTSTMSRIEKDSSSHAWPSIIPCT
jgi:hypothetical protein